ncbi:MAG: hypothetical protein IPJ25_08340 [Rhodocyclaceae bacterium]|nr:hypothetical protein [Rhodocyclaceae bacterium]
MRAYLQGTDTITKAITGTSGGNFEALTTTSTVSTSVVDDADTTVVTLSASAGSVTEGGTITYTASVNNPVTGSDLIVTLTGGVTITIPVGSSSANSTAVATRSDEAYLQGTDTITKAITGTSGGNFEALTTTSTVSTSVVDDADTTVVSLSGDASVVEGASAIYTISLTSPAQSDVTVTLNYSGTAVNGADISGSTTVVILAGTSSTDFSITANEDLIAESTKSFTLTIGSAVGGNFENLVVAGIGSGGDITTLLFDNDSAPTIALVSAASAIEASNIVHTVTLSNASSSTTTFALNLTDVNAAGGGLDYTSTLNNSAFSNGVTISGGTITVPAGVTSFTVSVPTSIDSIDEANETYTLTVGGVAGAGTILDDDFSPVATDDIGAVSENATLIRATLTGVIQGAPGADSDADNATTSLIVGGVVVGAGVVTQGVGVATSLAGIYGHLTLEADGSYSYVADQGAANALGAGVTVTDVFTYTVIDPSNNVSNAATLTITVTGTNDAAIITPATTTLTETNAALTTGGTMVISDVDSASTFTALTAVAGSNSYGTFSMSTAGVWTYTANSAHDEFMAGSTYTDSVSVTSADGTISSITVNILGTNDAAVITPASTTLTESNVALTTGGTMVISDVDSASTFTALTAVAGSNSYGTFSMSTAGCHLHRQ